MIYNIFGSGIQHKSHSIFKSKSQEFHNRNIGLFSVNETRMTGYFMEMHIDLQMQKVLQATISYAEFISIPTNTKFTKAVSGNTDEFSIRYSGLKNFLHLKVSMNSHEMSIRSSLVYTK